MYKELFITKIPNYKKYNYMYNVVSYIVKLVEKSDFFEYYIDNTIQLTSIFNMCLKDKQYNKAKTTTYKNKTHYAQGYEILAIYYILKNVNTVIPLDIKVTDEIHIDEYLREYKYYMNLQVKDKYICTVNVFLFINRYKEYIKALKHISKYYSVQLYIFCGMSLSYIIKFDSPTKQYIICPKTDQRYQVYLDDFKQKLFTVQYCSICKEDEWRFKYENYISSSTDCELFLIINYFYDKFGWNFKEITRNPNTTMDIIEMNPHISWNISELANNENFTPEYYILFSQMYYNNFGNIAQNSNFTAEDLLHFTTLDERSTFDFYEYADNNPYETFAVNKNFTINTYKKYPQIPWNICALFDNSNFNFEIIKQNFLEYENIKYALSNSSFTVKDLQYIYDNFPETHDDFFELCCTNKNLTLEFIKKYKNEFENSNVLGIALNSPTIKIRELLDDPISNDITISHPNTTIDLINMYPNKRWNFAFISQSPKIRMIDIDQNLHLGWSWKHISLNPNLTLEFILKHYTRPFDFRFMSANKFRKHPYFKHCVNLLYRYMQRYFCMHIYKTQVKLQLFDELMCKPSTSTFRGGIIFQEVVSELKLN